MMKSVIIFAIVFVLLSSSIENSDAESPVNIIMDKTTYSYCEQLSFTIEVPEITEDYAWIYISNELGEVSTEIPIIIIDSETFFSLITFEKTMFQPGEYFIDVDYSGSIYTEKFNLIDSDEMCDSEETPEPTIDSDPLSDSGGVEIIVPILIVLAVGIFVGSRIWMMFRK